MITQHFRLAGAVALVVSGLLGLVAMSAEASGPDTDEVSALTFLGLDQVPDYVCGQGFTLLQTSSQGDVFRAPTDGVLTQYRVFGGANAVSFTLKIGRPTSDPAVWAIAHSAAVPLPLPSNTALTVVENIPVRAGDVLGGRLTGASGACRRSGYGPDDEVSYVDGDVPAGATAEVRPYGALRLTVSAVFEPDGDQDGRGDVTQDRCDTDPTTQQRCATSAPQTSVRKTRIRRGRLVARLAATEQATFRCAVDSAVFRPCGRRFRTRLSPGRHELAVVAVDRYGNTDPTPAITRVTIKKSA